MHMVKVERSKFHFLVSICALGATCQNFQILADRTTSSEQNIRVVDHFRCKSQLHTSICAEVRHAACFEPSLKRPSHTLAAVLRFTSLLIWNLALKGVLSLEETCKGNMTPKVVHT